MKLNEKDKELIAKIDERLKHYKLITDNEQQAPVEEVVLDWYCHNKEENINIKCEVQCFNCMEELYFEPNIKDWVKGEGFIGTLKELSPRGAAYTIDDQDGSDWVISKENAIKPTKEEIEQHLVKIAEKKYPVGTRFKGIAAPDYNYEIVENCFEYLQDKNMLIESRGFKIWHNGVWAELITEQKERWKPNSGEEYYYINEVFTIQPTINSHFMLDSPRIEAGNCFKTQEEAERAAQAIRETLKNL